MQRREGRGGTATARHDGALGDGGGATVIAPQRPIAVRLGGHSAAASQQRLQRGQRRGGHGRHHVAARGRRWPRRPRRLLRPPVAAALDIWPIVDYFPANYTVLMVHELDDE